VSFALLSAALLAFFVGPLLAVLLADPKGAFVDGWKDKELVTAIGVSLGCAALAVAASVVFGTPLAYLLERRSFRGRSLVVALLSLPLVIPHPVVGIALLLLFARHRLLGSFMEGTFGIEIVSAAPGVVLAMLFVSAPIVVRTLQEGFRAVDVRLEQVAQNLGATPARAFWKVALPLVRPALFKASVSAFARSVSEFGSIAVLAYFPKTAPVLIWDRFNAYGLRGALPAAGLLLLVTLVIFLLWSITERRYGRLA